MQSPGGGVHIERMAIPRFPKIPASRFWSSPFFRVPLHEFPAPNLARERGDNSEIYLFGKQIYFSGVVINYV